MPTINMIANRRAEKRRQEQNVRKLIYGISAEVGCLIIAISVLSIRQLNVRSHEVDLTAQMQNLQPKVNKINALQSQIAELQPKVKTLDGAKQDTLFWYSNLYSVASSLPDKTWFTSLGIGGEGGAPGSGAGADPTINITGTTLNQALVGETMLRMNQSPGMDHIVLSFVQQQKTGSTDTVSFQMTAHLKPEPGAAAQGGNSNVSKA